MSHPETGQDLLHLFGDLAHGGYVDCVFLTDTKVGFSIQRPYPADIRFKPAKTPSGQDDDVAVIWVVYENNLESSESERVPIRLRIAKLSRYRQRHLFDDDDDDPERPTRESILQSRHTPQPLELSMRGYYFDPKSNQLVDEGGTHVEGIAVLDRLFDAHCKTVHPLFGIPKRGAEFVHGVSRSVLDRMINGVKWILKEVFGRSLVESQTRLTYLDGYDRSSLGRFSEDSVEFAGLKFSKHLVPLALMIFLGIAYLIFPVDDKPYARYVIQSEVIASMHILAILYLLEEILPIAIFHVLNLLIYVRKKYLNLLLQRSMR